VCHESIKVKFRSGRILSERVVVLFDGLAEP
jgi:hypothetical protein